MGRPRIHFSAIRFWSFVDVRSPQECWPWKAGCFAFPNNYGAFSISTQGKRRTWKAHRIAYILIYGPLYDSSLCVCHSCDNPPCCNPYHLWVGTQRENTLDRSRKGRTSQHARGDNNPWVKFPERMLRGEQCPWAKLTESQVREIIHLRGTLRNYEVAERYHVNRSQVSMIWHRKSWKHIQ